MPSPVTSRKANGRTASGEVNFAPLLGDDAGVRQLSVQDEYPGVDLKLPSSGPDDAQSLSVITPGAQTPAVRTVVATNNKLSPTKAAMSMLKCVVGAGSFILPSAVKDAGLATGFVSLLLLGALSAYTIQHLAEAGLAVRRANMDRRLPTYADVGLALFGRTASVVIAVGVVLTILGVCAVYLDFIGQLAAAVIGHGVTKQQVQGVLVLPVILLALLRDFRYLAWTSIVGDIAVIAGAVAVLVYGIVKHGLTSPTDLPNFHARTYSSFFGQAVFLFAVHTVLLPIAQAMKEPKRFGAVTYWTYLWLSIGNALFGAIGYMAFTDKTEGLVLSNLDTGAISDTVQMLLAVDLLFTIPIVLSAPRRIIERAFIPRGDPRTTLKENCARVVCVGLFVALALAVPDINDLATLIGGLVSPLMGFIFPPLFYIRLHWHDAPRYLLAFNAFIIVFGVFAGVLTTVQQIQKMVKE